MLWGTGAETVGEGGVGGMEMVGVAVGDDTPMESLDFTSSRSREAEIAAAVFTSEEPLVGVAP